MSCHPINPISSNHVTEVCIEPSRCMPNLKTLNEWLKWLGDKQCEIDWSSFDLSCVKDIEVEQTQKVVIETIIEGLCRAISCCNSSNIETKYNLTANTPFWSASGSSPLVALKRGSTVFIQGIVVEGSSTSQPVTFLPVELRPTKAKRIPVAYSYAFADTYTVFINIATDGAVTVVWHGTEPVGSGSIYLDGINFII